MTDNKLGDGLPDKAAPAEDLQQTGLDAVDKFLETFNSRDGEAWTDSLNFPHVRPAQHGIQKVSADADSYLSGFSYDRVIATGWDHSEWDYKHVVHTSENKIHVAGQWSRYTAAGDKILTTPIVYIVTRVEGKWGIQARFGSDYAGDEDTMNLESRAFNLFQSFAQAVTNNHQAVAAELLNYPHVEIRPGEIVETAAKQNFAFNMSGETAVTMTFDSMVALQTGNKSANVSMDVVRSADGGAEKYSVVALVTHKQDHLGIQAWSIIANTS